jgi:hypothetical protein
MSVDPVVFVGLTNVLRLGEREDGAVLNGVGKLLIASNCCLKRAVELPHV